jgi:hypothetical protein
VPVASAAGSTFSATSVRTPSVPWAPLSSLQRSRPVTFFSTRPPERKISPSPATARMPSTWSRIAPHMMRRGPDRLVETTPPSVAGSSVPKSARRSGGSAMSCWLCSASAASMSGMGVPARARIMSSVGR